MPETSEVTRIVASLLAAAEAPRTVGALEAALGVELQAVDLEGGGMGSFAPTRALGPLVQAVSVTYAWDIYHDNPIDSLAQLRASRLLDFSAHLTAGRSAVEAGLFARFGPPRQLAGRRAYDRWLVTDDVGEGCVLAFYTKLPDWAVDAADPAARAGFLRELVAVVGAAERLDAVERTARSAAPAAGVALLSGPTALDASVALELVPPIRAVDLAAVLGWDSAIGESRDVHMSSWTIRLVTGITEYGPSTEPPSYGAWNLVASLDRRASGGPVPGHPGGPVGRQRLGPADVVRYVRIGKPG